MQGAGWRGGLVGIAVLALVAALAIWLMDSPYPPVDEEPAAAGCSATSALPELPHLPVTYRGFHYGSDALASPTKDKAQHKLWYNDGAWWAVMLSQQDNQVRIHELLEDQSWRSTATVVDDRLDSTADVLWDGRKLFVASRHAGGPLLVLRYSYGSADRSYELDEGFPVAVEPSGTSSAVIEQDSTGRLWTAWVHGRSVWMAHSTTADQLTWSPPFVPPVSDTTTVHGDIASLVAFNGQVGLMWSNQLSESFRFAVHEDHDPPDQWSLETPLAGTGMADNHVDLKADEAGRVYAAIKTSVDDHDLGLDAPLTILLVRSAAGSWSQVTYGTLADNHSRPIVVIDSSNQELYMLATKGMRIVYKKAPLDAIAFAPGPGLDFVSAPDVRLDDATNSKQPVTIDSELPILANSTDDRHYYHAVLDIRPPGSADPLVPDVRPRIRFRAASTSTSAAASSLTIARPAGVAAGDLLLASVDVRGGDDISPPAGWQPVRLDDQAATLRKATYYRLAGPAEPAAYSWRIPGHEEAAGLILSYTGVDATLPIENATGRVDGGSPGSATAPSATILSRDTVLVGLFALDGSGDVTLPSTMTERARVADPSSRSGLASVASDAPCLSVGASEDHTARGGTDANGIGQLVVLKAAAGAAPAESSPLSPPPPGDSPPAQPGTGPAAPTPPGATIAFRSSSQAANTTDLLLTIERPAGVRAGDLLLASIDTRGRVEVTPPAGWQWVRLDENGSVLRKATFSRVAGSVEPASYTWQLSRRATAAGIIAAYRGVDPVNSIGATGGQFDEAQVNSIVAPSVAASAPGAVLVALFAIDAITDLTPGPTMTERAQIATHEAEHRLTVALFDAWLTTPGATGEQRARVDAPGRGIGQVVVLRPAN